MKLIVLNGESDGANLAQMERLLALDHIKTLVKRSQTSLDLGLVVGGKALRGLLQNLKSSTQLYQLAQCCAAVVACRVSPAQKAAIVNVSSSCICLVDVQPPLHHLYFSIQSIHEVDLLMALGAVTLSDMAYECSRGEATPTPPINGLFPTPCGRSVRSLQLHQSMATSNPLPHFNDTFIVYLRPIHMISFSPPSGCGCTPVHDI